MLLRFITSILFFSASFLSAQVGKREFYSEKTRLILNRLDSMLNINSTVEFRNVGEGMRISDKFVLYGKLVKTASEGELLDVVENKQEPKALRAYAYMAYAYQCDSKKRKEKPLNINFKISTLNGCIGYTDVTFPSFKTYIRKRNAYNPDPTYFVRDAEEERVIKEENKIRKEQGIEPRKEK